MSNLRIHTKFNTYCFAITNCYVLYDYFTHPDLVCRLIYEDCMQIEIELKMMSDWKEYLEVG